jgi:hypothetical protein
MLNQIKQFWLLFTEPNLIEWQFATWMERVFLIDFRVKHYTSLPSSNVLEYQINYLKNQISLFVFHTSNGLMIML